MQRDLLEAAVRARRGKIWLPREAATTLPTTYSALVGLQRRKLIEPDTAKDPNVVSWTVTEAGRDAVVPPERGRTS